MVKDTKTSRGLYIASGVLGCLPSLIFFWFVWFVLSQDMHMYEAEIFNCLFASLAFGVLGVIGLISAAVIRRKRNPKVD